MSQDIRKVNDMESLITYFSEKLNWNIDPEDFYDIDDITYEFEAEDLGLKDEAFAKIISLKQLQPLVDDQKWGIFFVEFDSQRFEVSALRKILSGLIPTRRNSAEHAVWDKRDLLFLCTWGSGNQITIGVAHFEDAEKGLPQIKMISCEPTVEDFTQINIFEQKLAKLRWPSAPTDTAAWREAWASAFTVRYRQVIQDSHTLTVCLAVEAKDIRDRILNTLKVETRSGYVHLLFEKFQNTLIHDMTEQQFADMYAQTIVYGLFSARCMDNTQDDFSPEEAVACIPNTNPFLKSLMQECFSSDRTGSKLSFDELEIGNIVTLLQNTKTDAIIADFNRQTGGGREDPVIHFYEEFLTEYDKAQKVQRGVYYTPQPVVNFIVRAVDDILKSEFGIADGLASTETKKIKITRPSKKRNQHSLYGEVEDTAIVPAIQVLDPATGTGTFLRQTILQIYQNFCDARKGMPREQIQKEWNEYVPKHLLPRLNGFELMMAPYAVAHMKLAMVLKDTCYDFHGEERLKVYLTNSLEEPSKSMDQLSFLCNDPLSQESWAANAVKRNFGINVVIGNPPYNGNSINNSDWILSLIKEYHTEPGGKLPLKEVKIHFGNDYVKFIRYAQNIIEVHQQGIIGFITPRDYMFAPTFRGMRWQLLTHFDDIYVIDLNGDARQNKNTDIEDENVFDIQQGVSISLFVKSSLNVNGLAKVHYFSLKGDRSKKYAFLNQSRLKSTQFIDFIPMAPFFGYEPNLQIDINSDRHIRINDIFINSVNGIQTGRDSLTIKNSKQEMEDTLKKFINLPPEEARNVFSIGSDGRDWKVEWAQQNVKNHLSIDGIITPILYRPFDIKWTFYSGPKGKGFLQCPRGKIMRSMIGTHNIALIIGRQGQAVGNIEWCLAYVTCGMPTDLNLFYRGGGMVFPLYQEEYTEWGKTFVPSNINEKNVNKMLSPIGLHYSNDINDKQACSSLTLLSYIYGVLYSKKYRKKYSKLLAIDFPPIPFPTNRDMFYAISRLGESLIRIHTMSDMCNEYFPVHLCGENNIIEKISFKEDKVHINKQQYFYPVPYACWEFQIGGYQPLPKWLKDRKGQELSQNDIDHYAYMVRAIAKTIDVMEEIDKIAQF